jgi:hydroxymethylbilane synthase
MDNLINIGTRESQLALWQATLVKDLLGKHGIGSRLILIKSEGDIDLKTPLYEMGLQGIFTRTLDAALLSKKIDIAVHSMKDVPTQLAAGIAQTAVLKRGNHKDILVKHERPGANLEELLSSSGSILTIATSSIRRKAQWLHRYPNHQIENLRGNVDTRLRKLESENWDAAIFAAAGLERIGIRPKNSLELDWMLPAPAQGAIMIVSREEDDRIKELGILMNDENTALCTKIERDFLKALMGGCSTPISAFAELEEDELFFRGNVLSRDGKQKHEIEKILPFEMATNIGKEAARELLESVGPAIADIVRNEPR